MNTYVTHPWLCVGISGQSAETYNINGAKIYWPQVNDSNKHIDITELDGGTLGGPQ